MEKTYMVEIKETLIYKIEVEATNKEEAERLAYESDIFVSSISTDNDSVVSSIEEVE